jgi:phosphodiesterase/alkaline phosphatase D-like protein
MKASLFPFFLAVAGVCCAGAAAQTNPYQATAQLPPANRASQVTISQGPAPERVDNNWAILRWTSNNPGGADEHFAVAHFGTSPNQLDQTAKSHIRLNRSHSDTIFRVRLLGLQPNTTYYYTVDSMGGDGVDDHVKSPVLHFTTTAQVASSR